MSAASGAATPWNPDADSDIYALAVPPGGATVFAGGDFTGLGPIGAAARSYLAELDAATGAATAWNPAPDDDVLALQAAGPDLFVGGSFRSMGPRAHSGFAQFTVPRLVPPVTPLDTTAPVISRLSMTNSVFAVGRRPTPVAASSRRVRRGTTFRYTLSEAAKVTIAFKRELPGLRVGGRCRLATAALTRRVLRQLAPRVRNLTGRARARRLRALLRRRACTVLRSRGKLTRNAALGRNATKFSGRVGRRALAPGRYRAVFTAVDGAGNRSAPPKRLGFRVVRAPRRR